MMNAAGQVIYVGKAIDLRNGFPLISRRTDSGPAPN